MTDKLRELLEDVQTGYEGKGMVVHPNPFDKLRVEVIKLDNVNRLQNEQIEKMKCCQNCKYMDFSELNYCIKGVYRERQYVCSKWELAE